MNLLYGDIDNMNTETKILEALTSLTGAVEALRTDLKTKPVSPAVPTPVATVVEPLKSTEEFVEKYVFSKGSFGSTPFYYVVFYYKDKLYLYGDRCDSRSEAETRWNQLKREWVLPNTAAVYKYESPINSIFKSM